MTFVKQRKWQVVGAAVVALVVTQIVLRGTTFFPESWNRHLANPVNDFGSWVRRNRDTNPFLHDVLRPIGNFVRDRYIDIRDVLLDLPWFWLPLLVFVVILRSGRWASAGLVAAGLLFVEFADLHKEGMETVALMLLCILACIIIGTPLGVLAGLHPRVERALRPVLDAMQSLPITFYLVPSILFFGIGQVPAAIATIIFGLPPMVRIVALGIRQVPPASVEAGLIFGSNRWQLLWKVQAPQSIKSFVLAVNQMIMMCLGMVVIGGLVGSGGLGAELFDTMKLRSPGRSFLVGLSIFSIAMAFDRTTRSLVDRRRVFPVPTKIYWGAAVGALVGSYVVADSAGGLTVPWTFDHNLVEPIDEFIIWIRDTFGDQLQWINDFIVRDVVIRLRDLLSISLAWPVLIGGVVLIAFVLRGWKFAVFTTVGLIGIGLLGMWEASLVTLAQLVVAVLIAIVVSVPIGIFVGQRPRLEAALEPGLDALQTLPSLIYAIPFVMLFQVGYVPGILATVIYAIPPGIRLTALAIKQVNPETLEAAITFGATPRQRLWGVHVPLAMKGIMLALNQVLMMALSMVIIAGFIGGQGLGFKAVEALTKPDFGVGVESGLALLVMAIILDRLSDSLANRFDVGSDDSLEFAQTRMKLRSMAKARFGSRA
ncbi:MAG: ABC transporter permease subunit [Actinomycetota bacterium]|nr:ABC transporter permease subunit [Actinomycetota bacterium]